MRAQSLQSCPTLCNSMDCSPLGSSVHGIFQAKILEWVTISSSRGSSQPGIEPKSPVSPALQADSLPLSHLGSPSICLYKHKSTSRRVDKKLIPVITYLVEEDWKEDNIRLERRFCSLVYPHTLNHVNLFHIATIK